MGGKSSSATTSNTTNNVDNRVFNMDGSGGNILTDIDAGGNVTMTDHGAVTGALDLGEEVVETMAQFGTKALEFNSNALMQQTASNTQNLQVLKGFAEDLQTEGQLQLSNTMKIVSVAVIAMSGLVLVVAMRGKK